MAKLHFYVVWIGRKTGVFDNWDDCAKSVNGYSGAKFKGFNQRKDAEEAFKRSYSDYLPADKPKAIRSKHYFRS